MSLIFKIKVIPLSSHNKWSIDSAGNLKCKLTKPPSNNLANNQLISLLSKTLEIPKNKIAIIFGQTSKNKQIKIDAPIEYQQLLHILKIDHQSTIK